MDIVLDSIGWSGGNTSLQAIELGKPIVTMPGEFMRSRHTYAMLKMMGLENHISESIEDYVSRAAILGRDGNLRSKNRLEILERKKLLYYDYTFIDGLDCFLKNSFSAIYKK